MTARCGEHGFVRVASRRGEHGFVRAASRRSTARAGGPFPPMLAPVARMLSQSQTVQFAEFTISEAGGVGELARGPCAVRRALLLSRLVMWLVDVVLLEVQHRLY